MDHIVQVHLDNLDDAVALQALMREMGYPAYRFSKQPDNTHRASDQRLGKLILNYMKPGRSYMAVDFMELLISHDYSPKSASPVFAKLAGESAVERMGHGVYVKSRPDAPAVDPIRKPYLPASR